VAQQAPQQWWWPQTQLGHLLQPQHCLSQGPVAQQQQQMLLQLLPQWLLL
jgi:hypothetical protein